MLLDEEQAYIILLYMEKMNVGSKECAPALCGHRKSDEVCGPRTLGDKVSGHAFVFGRFDRGKKKKQKKKGPHKIQEKENVPVLYDIQICYPQEFWT